MDQPAFISWNKMYLLLVTNKSGKLTEMVKCVKENYQWQQ